VDAHVARALHAILDRLGDALSVVRRLDHRQAAELRAGAADEVANDVAWSDPQATLAVQHGLGE